MRRGYLHVPGHALRSGRQEQLGRILNAACQLLALLHVEHQVRLRLCTALLQSTACGSDLRQPESVLTWRLLSGLAGTATA